MKDRFAISASLIYKNRQSYYRDSTTGGNELPDELTRAARIKLAWAHLDNLLVTVTGLLV